jgi:GINS complex subunit 2
MPLSNALFTPNQIEFLSEETTITIVPNFELESLEFLCGSVGPFRPGLPLKVPLWLAIHLKKRNKCTIQMPEWLELGNLQALYEAESEQEEFQKIPFHYMEIAAQLLEV